MVVLIIFFLSASLFAVDKSLKDELSSCKHQLICEGYKNNNWDLFIMDADGGNFQNLTNTTNRHELYPQVSPDGQMVAFVSDKGKGRKKVRSVWVMDINGKNCRKVADYARQPFWSPDSKILGYLPQEYKKFSVMDFSTKGICFYDLASKKISKHVNRKIRHIYNPGFSPDGNWIIATVHAGMGFKHNDILIKAKGKQVVNMKNVHGCRPSFSPDGKYIAWGSSSHLIKVAPIDLSKENPVVGKEIFMITDDKNKIYHVDFSANGKWLTISRGSIGKGDRSKPGTCQAAREVVGVYATDWNLFTIRIKEGGVVNMNNHKNSSEWVQITKDGCSYKEADWVPTEKEKDDK